MVITSVINGKARGYRRQREYDQEDWGVREVRRESKEGGRVVLTLGRREMQTLKNRDMQEKSYGKVRKGRRLPTEIRTQDFLQIMAEKGRGSGRRAVPSLF